jgi:hypothetical protein
MRVIFLAGFVFWAGCLRAGAETAGPPPPVDLDHLPWADGEQVTYLVSWLGVDAAEGTFTARKVGDHWEFDLKLASQGMVDRIYPFTGNFWCIAAPSPPWRSVEYGEYRFEPRKTIKERTRIDYATRQGTRENWIKGETKVFPIDRDAVDDVGTMLYHVRAVAWQPGEKQTLYVYESNSEKQAEVTCEGRETRAFGTRPAAPMLKISLLPTVGTHRRGHLTLWMTDDARHLPVHAELEFKYGTFDMDLEKDGTAEASPAVPGK